MTNDTSPEMKIIPTTLTVKPVHDRIFSDLATKVSIEDEAAGEFIVVSQQRGMKETQEIRIDVCEWEFIKAAIEQQICRIKTDLWYYRTVSEGRNNI